MGAGEAVRAAEKSRPALCVATPIYGEVGAAMFVWELLRGTVTREASMETR